MFRYNHCIAPGPPARRPGHIGWTGVFLLCWILLASIQPALGQMDSVPVWILATDPPERITIRAPEAALHIQLRGPSDRTITLEEGGPVTVRPDGDGIAIEGPGTRASIHAAVFSSASNRFLTVETSTTSRRYRGTLIIQVLPEGERLQLINHVAMPDYLTSVVASEYPFDDIEGTKAQAVIARTYAVRSGQTSNGAYDLTDNTASQAYRGLDQETKVARRAVEATREEILTHQGRVIEAVYSSSGGGHTADNENVWDTGPVPYLRGKPDPYDDSSPHQEWRFVIAKSMLHDMLTEEYGFEVRELRFDDRTASGRHHSLRLLGDGEQTITANTLRLIVSRKFGARSLKSTRFRVQETDEQYTFTGQGFGHGVGLSQWGAHARAEDGHSYEDILQFYYTSVAIETAAGEQLAAAQPAATEEQGQTDTGAVTESTASSMQMRHGGWSVSQPTSLDLVSDRPSRPGW